MLGETLSTELSPVLSCSGESPKQRPEARNEMNYGWSSGDRSVFCASWV